VTAEGFLDEQSFDGKVVGGVAEIARAAGVRCVALVGEVVEGLDAVASDRAPGLEVVSLVDRFGDLRARGDTAACVEAAVGAVLARCP
jgi:glycerate 2-kinase